MGSLPGLPETMLACQINQFKQPYLIHHVATPTPESIQPYDLLVKVAVASYCHTDSMALEGRVPGCHPPLTASHEGAGTVVVVGSSLSDVFNAGDRVMAGIPRDRCGQCMDCTHTSGSWMQYCSRRRGGIGLQLDGAFAEYMVIDGREASKLPEGVSFLTAAPLACAGITAWRGVATANLIEGQWLCIVGAGGGLGHLAVQFAKAQGLKVIGIDARDEGIRLAKECGADEVVDVRLGMEAVVKNVQQWTGREWSNEERSLKNLGATATINLSDAAEATALACAVTAKHGRVVQIAQPKDVIIPYAELVFRDITIVGSLTANRTQAQEMLDSVAKNGIRVETNRFHGISEVPNIVKFAHSGKMKGKAVVIVDPTQVEDEFRP